MRLVLVTRRFWPLTGGAETVMARLAAGARRRGARPLVLTAQWDLRWPRRVTVEETPVERLPQPRARAWGTYRYVRALARRLRAEPIDAVCVSMLKHDAYAAIGAMRGRPVPVVLRAEGGGSGGDCAWQETARWGDRIRRRCREADAIVAPSEAVSAELRAAGYPDDRIRVIPNGVPGQPPRSPELRRAARLALSDAVAELAAPLEAPVVVFTGRLHRAKGLFELVEAWFDVARARPDAQLWLIGEGPDRQRLYQRITARGLQHRVVLPGAFDDVAQILQAADVFVLPSYEEGLSVALLEAMAAGLPAVVSNIAANRELVRHDEHGLLVPPRDPLGLARAITALLDNPARAHELGRAARRRAADFSLDRMVDAHLELAQQLMRAVQRGGV